MRIHPGDELELNEHGNIAWGCRQCFGWCKPEQTTCRCGYRREGPSEVPSTWEEWVALVNVANARALEAPNPDAGQYGPVADGMRRSDLPRRY